MPATARELYVHLNTVLHRLGRITDVAGLDAAALKDRIAFMVGL